MNKFISFIAEVGKVSQPKKFDYPHNYTPHFLAKTAAKELQEYLENQTDFNHNFGLKKPNSKDALGKMFGVLVVKKNDGEIGYLAAFSGKIAETTHHKKFVPPVYDVLVENGVFLKTEEKNNQINLLLSELESNIDYLTIKKSYLKRVSRNETLLSEEKKVIKARRKLRKELSKQDNQLNINEEFYLREYEVYLNTQIASLQEEYNNYLLQIQQLKQQRKELSAAGQQEIFKQYQFLNAKNEKENLLTIFKDSSQNIPAGAGDCCAPKLLQYAFLNNLTPICMAEFWWGKPSATAVRKHQHYYSACTGKCKPILHHMLQGLTVDDNPLIAQFQVKKEIEVIFEDEYLLVINKPHELLSVAGKEVKDSVYSRIKKKYPNATGPLIVHRLDMSTSGILLIAKNEIIHKNLQAQFINRTIKKRYVALLHGSLYKKNGEINLPLRVDLDDRPKQLVCYEQGKKALTKWEVIEVVDSKTKVYFYPITGRTHQLRVHAAHQLGLNIPIVGDDLYGTKANRLYLHAENLSFRHPISKKEVQFTSPATF
ncbi:RluA family pseudouridine synthase [Tenacibaculum sp. AHE15PA]|uniref:RluA family pseudouridine synthase n=1 Tax=unclassified Tenacibaculum TaxID=2635139 RepID=UPI001C4F02CC|nr:MULTISPECIES: RluA family pseudouridine synthase [unclassified Tenacibaculum]QXP73668.1 RluA family pseudouridine synthase [Tenacibaculum sp. AHE14PA]QXP75965.1 RluA family pseudouridine synthase [Tenacibaculum sp. AHE15PA]